MASRLNTKKIRQNKASKGRQKRRLDQNLDESFWEFCSGKCPSMGSIENRTWLKEHGEIT